MILYNIRILIVSLRVPSSFRCEALKLRSYVQISVWPVMKSSRWSRTVPFLLFGSSLLHGIKLVSTKVRGNSAFLIPILNQIFERGTLVNSSAGQRLYARRKHFH